MKLGRLLAQHSYGRRLGLLGVVVVLVLVIGLTMTLSSAWPWSNQYKVATAYSSTEGIGFDGGSQGVLEGQTNKDGTACFWIGSGTDRMVLVWPQGYSARGRPTAIVGTKGKTLATVGDFVVLRGGLAPVGSPAALGCAMTTQEFLVGEVIQATSG